MTLIELKELLEQTGFPVAYSHFKDSEITSLPDFPFICYLVVFSPNFIADDMTFQKIDHVQIELYTAKKDEVAESILEKILQDNFIPHTATESYIESEDFYQKIYETRLL